MSMIIFAVRLIKIETVGRGKKSISQFLVRGKNVRPPNCRHACLRLRARVHEFIRTSNLSVGWLSIVFLQVTLSVPMIDHMTLKVLETSAHNG